MIRTNRMLKRPDRKKLAWLVMPAVLTVLVVASAQWSFAQGSGPKNFSSAAEACQALYQAVKNNDEQAVEAILGAGKDVTSLDDETENKLERQRFSQKYQEMHRLVQEPDGTTVLHIGAENWPFPIPLVSTNGTWHFDSQAGAEEILFRAIGENEATAVEVCRALLSTSKQQRTGVRNDGIREYAEIVLTGAAANAHHAPVPSNERPFHGYYFRIVPARSGNAAAVKRLAIVAYPAEYRSSGVMTFAVTQDGVVYEKDLGFDTAKLAQLMDKRPAAGWHVVQW